MRTCTRLRLHAATVVAAALLAAAAPSAAGASEPGYAPATAMAGCAGATVEPTRANLRMIRQATLCLINRERTSRRLHPLRSNARLRVAAVRHSRDMISRAYFEHRSPGGRDVSDRLARTGYLSARFSWSVGENLAWGTGWRATPRNVVESWMQSSGHRRNILDPHFREIGLGVVVGVPAAGGISRGATYTTTFGRRR
jgi:uncharacterized protein YkwD